MYIDEETEAQIVYISSYNVGLLFPGLRIYILFLQMRALLPGSLRVLLGYSSIV